MSQLTPTTGPIFVGKASGSIPNLFWRRITSEQLRAQPQYQGLPLVEHLSFESTADFRKVRQESQLWTDLHRGLLTTGKLNAALGFYEPAAAKRLGIPRDRVNHNSLLSAAANLQLPSYGLQLLDTPAAPVIPVEASTDVAPLPPGLETAITVSEYEAAAIKLVTVTATNGAISRSKRARMRKQKQRQEQQQQQQQQTTGGYTPGTAAAVSTAAGPIETSLDPYGTLDARRNRCLTVATRGEGGLRMAWGSTQEAAALFSVIHLFPNSQLQEVGLCWVDPKRQIPKSWGFQSENLPPLGASPDGLIRHRSVAPAPASAERSHAVPSDVSGVTVAAINRQSPDQIQAQSSNTAVQQRLNGPGLLQIGPDSQLSFNPVSQPAAAKHAQQPSMQSIQMQDPALSEFEALLTKLEISSKNLVCNPLRSGSTSGTAPQTHNAQLSPQLLSSVSSTSASAAPALSASATPFSPTTHSQQSVMATCSPESSAAAGAAAGHTHGNEGADYAAHPEEEGCQEEWLEAVEIKNVCPFREARDVSSNGKSRRLYRLSDPGPYSRVPCHFVPQLQMEMLATGANSALIVSRSATKGARVFRMQRHAGFLQQMLHTISQMYTKYVKRNLLPPPNMFFEQAAYQQFLRTTQQVAESVEVVIDSEVQALPHVKDNRMFL